MSNYSPTKFETNFNEEDQGDFLCEGKKGKAKTVFINKLKSFLK